MPLNAPVVSSGGDLPDEIRMNLNKFVHLVDKKVEYIARKNGLTTSQVRLLRSCNVAFIVNEHTIFCVMTNINASGVVKHFYINWFGKPLNLNDALFLVERDLGFEQTFGIQFPYDILQKSSMEQENLSESIASTYIDEEIVNLERLNKIVRMNPVFNGRDFMIDDSKVFMLSPFSDPFNDIYKDHIKPTVESAVSGLICSRADNIYGNQSIIEDIWKSINEAKIIISELTGRNPNVFYETGIAHTVGKEVILLTQSMEDVPFDLRHLRCIVYNYTPPGVKSLEDNLTNTIRAIINK
ncbi:MULTISPECIES: hypothetical protein [Bacillus]|uniref:hypothetical protein n=1 Tax=Bacillus TaxID=1386 RepID=UPI000BF67FEC|nr:hypothetical protein [Bacillus cereus]PFR75399.1 hypothetical protein COK42_30410 [Bacillus cereus]